MIIRAVFSQINIGAIVNSGEKKAGHLMSRLRSAAAKGTVRYVPTIAESLIEKKIRGFIAEKKLGIEIDSAVLLKKEHSEEVTGIAVFVSRIDYAMLFTALRPAIEEKLADSESDETIRAIISVIGGDCENVVSSASNAISDEKKSQIAQILIKKYNKKICREINKAAKENGIELTVSGISVKV